MLEKTIKTVIKKKLNDWLSTIEDEEVRKKAEEDVVVTGGCFTSLLLNETPKDYDVYFKNRDTTISVARYYVNKFNKTRTPTINVVGRSTQAFVLTKESFEYISDDEIKILDLELASILGENYFVVNNKNEEVTDKNYYGMTRMIANLKDDRIKIYINSNGISGVLPEDTEIGVDPVDVLNEADQLSDDFISEEKGKYRPVFLSTNAITLSDGIQIVVRFFGEPSEIHDTFDFTHTKAYYYIEQDEKGKILGPKLSIPKDVYECVLNKTLVYTGSKYPVCSVIRIRKFIQRGWTINAGQILKMCMQISELDLTNIDVLEDQLVGVDSLYFIQLINQFRKQKEENKDFEISSTYINSIIDKIF